MASEKKIWEIIKEAGFEPIENRAVVVKYAPENLSQKLINFFSMEFYVLQLCTDKIVLIPFSALSLSLKDEITLQIPYSSIKSLQIEPDGLNYTISLETETDKINLSIQQKELSDFRSSGALAVDGKGLKLWNWHKENFDATIESLKELKK